MIIQNVLNNTPKAGIRVIPPSPISILGKLKKTYFNLQAGATQTEHDGRA